MGGGVLVFFEGDGRGCGVGCCGRVLCVVGRVLRDGGVGNTERRGGGGGGYRGMEGGEGGRGGMS